MPSPKISACLSCTQQSCDNCQERSGTHNKPGAPSQYCHARMTRWFRSGMTTADIAKETGVSLSTARRWYAKYQEEIKIAEKQVSREKGIPSNRR